MSTSLRVLVALGLQRVPKIVTDPLAIEQATHRRARAAKPRRRRKVAKEDRMMTARQKLAVVGEQRTLERDELKEAIGRRAAARQAVRARAGGAGEGE